MSGIIGIDKCHLILSREQRIIDWIRSIYRVRRMHNKELFWISKGWVLKLFVLFLLTPL